MRYGLQVLVMTLSLFGMASFVSAVTTETRFGTNDAVKPTSTKTWKSAEGWESCGSGLCYLRYHGVGLQGNKGAMQCRIEAATIAWFEVTAYLPSTSSIKGQTDTLNVTFYTAAGESPVEEVNFVFEAADQGETARLVFSEPLTEVTGIRLASTTGNVVTVYEVRFSDTPEALYMKPRYSACVPVKATTDVTVECFGGSGVYDSLLYRFNGAEGLAALYSDDAGQTLAAFGLTMPTVSGKYPLEMVLTDSSGNSTAKSVELTVTPWVKVEAITVSNLSPDGFSLAWEPPAGGTPDYYAVEWWLPTQQTVTLTVGDINGKDLTAYTQGQATEVWCYDVFGTSAYTLNGVTVEGWKEMIAIDIPEGDEQVLTFASLDEATEVRLAFYPEVHSKMQMTTAIDIAFPAAGQTVCYRVSACYPTDSGSEVSPYAEAHTVTLPALAGITQVTQTNGTYIPNTPQGMTAHYQVIAERVSVTTYPQALYVSKLWIDTTNGTKAMTLTNTTGSVLPTADYTISNINDTGLSSNVFDDLTATLPPGDTTFVYKKRLDAEAEQVMVDASGFFNNLNSRTVEVAYQGNLYQRIRPKKNGMVTLSSEDFSSMVESALDLDTFFTPWMQAPATAEEVVTEGVGNAVLAGRDWSLLGATRIVLRYTAVDAQGQRAEPYETVLWESADAAAPGYQLRLR